MTRIELAIEISAPGSRVWRALCDVNEVPRWDSMVVEALDAPPNYPHPGQHVRWRLGSGLWRRLHDRPQEVVPEQRLRSQLGLGSYEMDETYALQTLGGGCHLSLSLDLRVRVPLLGLLIERLIAARAIREGFEESLAGLKQHCEAGEAPGLVS